MFTTRGMLTVWVPRMEIRFVAVSFYFTILLIPRLSCVKLNRAISSCTKKWQRVISGFGHIGITVPNVYTACERFHSLNVPFHKSPNSGGMKGLAFIKDPDGYLVEVLPQGEMIVESVDCLGVESDGGDGYKDNSK